jgi:hypothetical protein
MRGVVPLVMHESRETKCLVLRLTTEPTEVIENDVPTSLFHYTHFSLLDRLFGPTDPE